MQRVIKVKDKKDKSSERPIRVGDLITSKTDTNKTVLLVTGKPYDGMAYVFPIRDVFGKVVKNPTVNRMVIRGYEHYRGKITIKQD